jgi:hypothetical protein
MCPSNTQFSNTSVAKMGSAKFSLIPGKYDRRERGKGGKAIWK